MGEKFRGVVDVSNTSKSHSVTRLQVKVTLIPQKRVPPAMQAVRTVVLNTEVPEILPNKTWSPVFEIDISDVDSYMY